ncbi:hypothetical protein AB0L85_28235 [Streptomyces sp. NPDC052051]|uniref:hypothetical protein n=1 Tax=Streptomyces sp. NPDC052051 TaxID=3154649 RepID=UPI00344A85C4
MLAIPTTALARKPTRLSFEEAAATGVNFVTAWLGTVETARLAEGESIAVIGVTGGVGGAVAQIARSLGAHVIGLARTPRADNTPAASAMDAFVPLDNDAQHIGEQVMEVTGGPQRDPDPGL